MTKTAKSKLLVSSFYVLLLIGLLVYLFKSDISFNKPLPILHQQNDSTYIDSINYVIDIYALEKKQFDLRQHEKVYEWQHKSTIVIFITVILVVVTGLYLSYKQFEFTNQVALLQAKHHLSDSAVGSQQDEAKSSEHQGETAKENNTFEISKSGIKITSAVIGLIILAMSIAFFILYLKFVYHIDVAK